MVPFCADYFPISKNPDETPSSRRLPWKFACPETLFQCVRSDSHLIHLFPNIETVRRASGSHRYTAPGVFVWIPIPSKDENAGAVHHLFSPVISTYLVSLRRITELHHCVVQAGLFVKRKRSCTAPQISSFVRTVNIAVQNRCPEVEGSDQKRHHAFFHAQFCSFHSGTPWRRHSH